LSPVLCCAACLCFSLVVCRAACLCLLLCVVVLVFVSLLLLVVLRVFVSRLLFVYSVSWFLTSCMLCCVSCFSAGENTTHQLKRTCASRGLNKQQNRRLQFPRLVILTPDDDHIGRNMW
jgi:hypothetical protein